MPKYNQKNPAPSFVNEFAKDHRHLQRHKIDNKKRGKETNIRHTADIQDPTLKSKISGE